ncbi:MAG: hypothetical protein NZ651_05130 [Candidatus Bipolaricaulota bacterium]|nr:hypothetical protein [Candidatus Bipolaricaulota bacterium]MDW8127137.1 hypothetical protein [Candidatus Bipolaricaulota bacterium]
MGKALLALAILGVIGLADTLVLTDGTVLEGRVSGVTATTISFTLASGAVSFPLEKVTRVTLDFSGDPTPRMERRQWSRVLGQVQREFFACRYLQEGLVVAGLAFIGFGQWLNFLGYNLFGNMLTAFGGISILWGLSMPAPGCETPASRLRTLLYLGLEHGWLY